MKEKLSRQNTIRRLAPGLALALLLSGMLSLVFSPILFSPNSTRVMGVEDNWSMFGPWAYYQDCAIAHGEFPQWNPLTYCGQPFAANQQTASFYAPHLLRALFSGSPTPLKTHWGLFLLSMAHVLAGGLGAYKLARKHGVSPLGAAVCAVAYACGSEVSRRAITHWQFVVSLAWLPWFMLCARNTIDAKTVKGRLRNTLLLGLLFALHLPGTLPQLILYEITALGCYWLVYRLLLAEGPSRLSGTAKDSALFLLAGVLALLLAMPLLLPAMEYAAHTPRTKSMFSFDYYRDVMPSPLYFLRGVLTYSGVRYGGSAGIRMAGPIVFLIAMQSVLHKQRRDWLLFATMLLALWDCALGPPFPLSSMWAYLAPFKISVPARAIVTACLPLAVLAGFGTDALRTALAERPRKYWTHLYWAGTSVLVLLLLWRWPDPYGRIGLAGWLIPFLFVLVCTIAGMTRLRPIAGVVILSFVVVELALWGATSTRSRLQEYGYPEAIAGRFQPFKKETGFQFGNHRVMAEPQYENAPIYALKATPNGYDPLFIEEAREVLYAPDGPDLYYANREVTAFNTHLQSDRGNLFLKRPFWLTKGYVSAPLPDKNALFPPSLVCFIEEDAHPAAEQFALNTVRRTSVHEPDESSIAVPSPTDVNDSITCYRFTIDSPNPGQHSALRFRCRGPAGTKLWARFSDAKTCEWTWGAWRTVNADDTVSQFEWPLPDFAQMHVEVFSESPNGNPVVLESIGHAVDRSDECDAIDILAQNANSVELAIRNASGPRMLLFTDAAYPGWQAFVDGNPTRIYKANKAFKAIAIPAGAHDVRFAFASTHLARGLAMSALTGALSLGLLAYLCYGASRQKTL